MNPTDFTNQDSGRVIRAPQGYFAFLPAPLPPKIVYDDEMVFRLSRADAALSELAGIGAMLPNPALLIGPYIRREAVLSSRIEGARTGFSDLMESEIAQAPETGDLLDVQNYVRALEYGIARLPSVRGQSADDILDRVAFRESLPDGATGGGDLKCHPPDRATGNQRSISGEYPHRRLPSRLGPRLGGAGNPCRVERRPAAKR